MRRAFVAGLMIFPSAVAFGQSFEVASIKPAQPSTDGRLHVWRNVDQTRLSYLNVSLHDMMKDAFHVQDEQIVGPDWLATERFDVTARIPDGARSHIPEMLAALMVERFGLSFHRETKDMARYSLGLAKGGLKLQKADSPHGLTSNTGRACNHADGQVTMTALTDFLSQQLRRPVADNTGLEDAYRVSLEWAGESAGNDAETCGPSLTTAVQEQLGLNLSVQKGPVEILVVDRAARVPTEN